MKGCNVADFFQIKSNNTKNSKFEILVTDSYNNIICSVAKKKIASVKQNKKTLVNDLLKKVIALGKDLERIIRYLIKNIKIK